MQDDSIIYFGFSFVYNIILRDVHSYRQYTSVIKIEWNKKYFQMKQLLIFKYGYQSKFNTLLYRYYDLNNIL